MTSKLKVGDKVRVVEEHFYYSIGSVVEVVLIDSVGDIKVDGIKYPSTCGYESEFSSVFIHPSSVELANNKPSKNQRITALEETVTKQGEEINELKLIVAQIRKPSTVVQEALATASSVEDISPVEKSPNQQRAEMIEKAKKFIDENGGDDYHFDIDEKKGTVFAYKAITPSVGRCGVKRGFSKCNPNDVFNTDIGKVISFGRAEKLDVSEFEQAVQPNEVVVGMKIRNEKDFPDAFHAPIFKGQIFNVVSNSVHNGECNPHSGVAYSATIINDTNAQYSEVVE